MKTILDEGIKNGKQNGAKRQIILLKNALEEKFKIVIHSESFVNQSYAKLYKWTTNEGWSIIHGKNPKKDYDIDISYSSNFSQATFAPIIKDLKKLAKHF